MMYPKLKRVGRIVADAPAVASTAKEEGVIRHSRPDRAHELHIACAAPRSAFTERKGSLSLQHVDCEASPGTNARRSFGMCDVVATFAYRLCRLEWRITPSAPIRPTAIVPASAQLICPSGCFTTSVSSPFCKNILVFRRPKSLVYLPPSRPDQRGVGHRRERWDGLRWTRQR
jgi:hypothetical protein